MVKAFALICCVAIAGIGIANGCSCLPETELARLCASTAVVVIDLALEKPRCTGSFPDKGPFCLGDLEYDAFVTAELRQMFPTAVLFVFCLWSASVAEFRKAKVDLYLLSLCPDTIKFMQEQFWPNYHDLKDLMDVNYVIYGLANTTEVPCDIPPPPTAKPVALPEAKPGSPIRALRFRRQIVENSTEKTPEDSSSVEVTSELIAFVHHNVDDPISSSLLELAPLEQLMDNGTETEPETETVETEADALPNTESTTESLVVDLTSGQNLDTETPLERSDAKTTSIWTTGVPVVKTEPPLQEKTETPIFAQNKDNFDIDIFKDTPKCYRFECYHGPEECRMNMYMNCAMEQLRERKQQKQLSVENSEKIDKEKNNCSCDIARFLHCAFGKRNVSDAAECSEMACLDHEQLTTCSQSQIGSALHAAAGEATRKFRDGLDQKFTVPTIAINGNRVKAAEKSFKAEVLASMGFKRGMCERVAGMLNQLAPFLNVPCF